MKYSLLAIIVLASGQIYAKDKAVFFGVNNGKQCTLNLEDIKKDGNYLTSMKASFGGNIPRKIGERYTYNSLALERVGDDVMESREVDSNDNPLVKVKLAKDGKIESATFQNDGVGASCKNLTQDDPNIESCSTYKKFAASGSKIIECSEVVSSDVNTYFASTKKNNDYVNSSKICILEDGLNQFAHTLFYSSSITYRGNISSVNNRTKDSASMKENQNFFSEIDGIVELRADKKDPNVQDDDVYNVEFNRDDMSLKLYHGVNKHLTWTGFKYKAHVEIEYKNCKEYIKP